MNKNPKSHHSHSSDTKSTFLLNSRTSSTLKSQKKTRQRRGTRKRQQERLHLSGSYYRPKDADFSLPKGDIPASKLKSQHTPVRRGRRQPSSERQTAICSSAVSRVTPARLHSDYCRPASDVSASSSKSALWSLPEWKLVMQKLWDGQGQQIQLPIETSLFPPTAPKADRCLANFLKQLTLSAPSAPIAGRLFANDMKQLPSLLPNVPKADLLRKIRSSWPFPLPICNSPSQSQTQRSTPHLSFQSPPDFK
jgi:hypothetical protein